MTSLPLEHVAEGDTPKPVSFHTHIFYPISTQIRGEQGCPDSQDSWGDTMQRWIHGSVHLWKITNPMVPLDFRAQENPMGGNMSVWYKVTFIFPKRNITSFYHYSKNSHCFKKLGRTWAQRQKIFISCINFPLWKITSLASISHFARDWCKPHQGPAPVHHPARC